MFSIKSKSRKSSPPIGAVSSKDTQGCRTAPHSSLVPSWALHTTVRSLSISGETETKWWDQSLITFRCVRGCGTLCTNFNSLWVLDIIYHLHFGFHFIFFLLLFFNAESHDLYLLLHAVCILYTGQKHPDKSQRVKRCLLGLRFPQIRDY